MIMAVYKKITGRVDPMIRGKRKRKREGPLGNQITKKNRRHLREREEVKNNKLNMQWEKRGVWGGKQKLVAYRFFADLAGLVSSRCLVRVI